MPVTSTTTELRDFLAALWPTLDGWLLFWGAPSKRSAWAQARSDELVDSLAKWAEKENVYVGCATRSAALGPTLRGERKDCRAIPGLWLDVDYGTEHKKPNLPPTEADAQRLLDSLGLPPSAVIHSGRGLHAWWLFREPWSLESDADRDQAETLTKAWCATLRATARAQGWDADQVGDLPRVMRLPGTYNHKGVRVRTRLVSLDPDRRYNPSEFEPYLTAEPVPAESLPNLTWTFTLSPTAEPPATKFLHLCEIDTKFRLAWEHRRPDLQDQSASSYDLSLAIRALAAQWEPQEIVNLLIAHRRKHHADPGKSLRRDYFESTLNKALASRDAETRADLVERIQAGGTLPAEAATDPAEILAILSSQLGVTITRFVRYRAEHNTYQLEINGHLIDVGPVARLDNQTEFRRFLLDHSDIRIPTFKRDAWDSIVTRLFLAVENVDVAMATSAHAWTAWIEQYLGDGLATQDWERAAMDGTPFQRNGHVYLCSEPFRMWLKHQAGQILGQSAFGVQMTKLGHTHEVLAVRHRGKSTRRTVWRLGHV